MYDIYTYACSESYSVSGLDEECFRENCTYENLHDKLFLQPLQSLIDSKEKEQSLVCFDFLSFFISFQFLYDNPYKTCTINWIWYTAE